MNNANSAPTLRIFAILALFFGALMLVVIETLHDGMDRRDIAYVVLLVLFAEAILVLFWLTRRRRSTPSRMPMAQYVANEAMKRANHVAGRGEPRLGDIGILAYRDSHSAEVYRRHDIPGSVTHIRPFVVLHEPDLSWFNRAAIVRFELADPAEARRFVAECALRPRRGPNFVTPDNWLPLPGDDSGSESVSRAGRWKMRVTLDDRLVGLHPFRVKPVYVSELSGYLSADGEIDEVLAAEIEAPEEAISLHALLKGESAGLNVGKADQRSNTGNHKADTAARRKLERS